MKKKVFTVGAWPGNTHHSDWIKNSKACKQLEEADLVVLRGGSDISPEMYGAIAHPQTRGINIERDLEELSACVRAERLGIPIVGLCRGSQILASFSGNKLVQHTNNHHGGHTMQTLDGKLLKVTSIHHQMQWPVRKDAIVLGWTNRSTIRQDENMSQVMDKDVEVVYYGNINSLGIQSHPEMSENKKTLKWFNKVIEHYLFKVKIEKNEFG